MAKETIILPVRARHFEGAIYGEVCNCGIANAADDFFNADTVIEGAIALSVIIGTDEKAFKHLLYNEKQFNEDFKKATDNNFDDTLIREIELTPA